MRAHVLINSPTRGLPASIALILLLGACQKADKPTKFEQALATLGSGGAKNMPVMPGSDPFPVTPGVGPVPATPGIDPWPVTPGTTAIAMVAAFPSDTDSTGAAATGTVSDATV